MTGETNHNIAEEEVEMTSQATIASIYDSEKVSILHFLLLRSLGSRCTYILKFANNTTNEQIAK